MRLRSSQARSPPPTTSITSLISLLHSRFRSGWNLQPILENLYGVICPCVSVEVNSHNNRSYSSENGPRLKFEDIITLSSLLFDELYRKLSFISHDASVEWDFRLALSRIGCKDSAKELLLLLRCCLLMVSLNPDDQAVAENFKNGVAFLQRLFLQVLSSQSTFGSCKTSPSEDLVSSLPFLKSMLEVYVDEVFAHRPFQERLTISDSVSSSCQSRLKCSCLQIQSILEVIAAHFLLSVSGDHAQRPFVASLFWTERLVPLPSEICLTVGLSLIKHPVVMSSPLILYSHLISLVSEAVGISRVPETVGPYVGSCITFLSAFYESVILYSGHISKLMSSSTSQSYTPGKIAQRSFEPLFHSKIYDRLNLLLVDMGASWKSQVGNMFTTKIASGMAIDAISYIQANVCIIDESCRDHASAFMSSLISRIISSEITDHPLQKIRALALPEICVVASILKLMSCSLLQATRHSKSVLSYPSLSGIMGCFAGYNFLPIKVQQFIDESLIPGLSTNDAHKLMFVHFAGLLSLCVFSGSDILAKGCLFVMLVTINLLIQKERCSVSVGPQAASEAKSSNPAFSPSTFTTPVAESTGSPRRAGKRKSCLRAASKFQRARQFLLRIQSALEVSDVSDEMPCTGELYLQCLMDNQEDIAELADFVECNQRKDYTAWLLDKGKYRSMRLKKFAKQRKMRKMKVYCSMVGHKM